MGDSFVFDAAMLLVGLIFNIAIGALIGQLWRAQPVGGGALGVICGPLGWLAIVLLPDQRAKCLDCRRTVHPMATKCGCCGGENLTTRSKKA